MKFEPSATWCPPSIVVSSERQGLLPLGAASFAAATLAATLLALAVFTPSAGAVSFTEARSYPAGEGADAVAIGDLNGDGIPDIVTTDEAEDVVSLLFGEAEGRFGTAQTYPVGTEPRGVAIGDLNGDGISDIVAADSGSAEISVLLGEGDGRFRPAVDYAVGAGPTAVAIADLNGDGRQDVVVADWDGGTISVLLGEPDRSLGTARSYAAGPNPYSLAVGDVDGDGTPDLVTGDLGSDAVSVLHGIGNGEFAAPSEHTVDGPPLSVALGDLNGDSIPDIVTANEDPATVSVLLGTGGGSFEAATNLGIGGGGSLPTAVLVADLNGDGDPDLAVADATQGALWLLPGDGAGGFGPAERLEAGIFPYGVATADLDDDGRPDLVTANQGGDVSVLLAKTAPTVVAQASAGVTLGGAIHGTATLTGGRHPIGAILFSLYGPGEAACAGAPLYTATVAVDGDGTYESPPYVPVTQGAYRWLAAYTGDEENEPADEPCGAAAQVVRIAEATVHPSAPVSSPAPLPASEAGPTAPRVASVRISYSPNRRHLPDRAGGPRYTFRFAGSSASTFGCRIDGGSFEPCRSPKVYRHLRPGLHVFRVMAVGAQTRSPVRVVRFFAGRRR